MEKYSQNQRERLNYLEFRIFFTGQVNRSDLIQRFGISEAAATRDLAIYKEEAPGNIELDNTTKIYRITDAFELHCVKDVEPKSILRALVHGIGDDFGVPSASLIPCELPTRLHAPDINTLAVVSRAIYGQQVLKVKYLSASGGSQLGTREIVPFSLAGNGLRWHVRAFDRRKNRFGDFIINRIKSAQILKGEKPKPEECKDKDDEWNRMVNLEIVAHPDYDQKAMIEAEYGMEGGVLRHKARAAMVGYILRLWNVDCSPNHSLGRNNCHLWLRNLAALYGIDNAQIAPGFTPAPVSEPHRG
ncbi:MAG: WYL domain-containing protein [Verrucomicrobia bacterium]|nr:WYL domain-containing protein [Verrucomicrobiota bacterium]